jgi:hypothetical protein
MTAIPPSPAVSQQAAVDAALPVLKSMGLSLDDLTAAPGQRAPVPTFADYVPVVSATVTSGTRKAYGRAILSNPCSSPPNASWSRGRGRRAPRHGGHVGPTCIASPGHHRVAGRSAAPTAARMTWRGALVAVPRGLGRMPLTGPPRSPAPMLQVRELERSAAFYERCLGLKRSDAGPPHAVVFDTKPIAYGRDCFPRWLSS